MVHGIESINFLIALLILLYNIIYCMSGNREKRRNEETMMLREREKMNQV